MEQKYQDIWVRIFLFADNETLLNCSKTCKMFREILKSDSFFWIQKAKHVGKEDCLPLKNWRFAAKLNRFANNAVAKKTSEKFKFDYRKMVLSGRGFGLFRAYEIDHTKTMKELMEKYNFFTFQGGNGIGIEENGIGCDADPRVPSCFALSFTRSFVYIFVDLVEAGIDEWVLDHVRPTIRINQKVNHRFDCASKITLFAELMEKKPVFVDKFRMAGKGHHGSQKRFDIQQKTWNQWQNPCEWEDLTVDIKDYQSGMRFVLISSSGRDRQYWAGHYGPKIGNLEVQFILPDNTALKRRTTIG